MKEKLKKRGTKMKMCSLLFAIMMLMSVLAACTNNGGNNAGPASGSDSEPAAASSDNAAGPGTSEKVELVWYVLGDPPKPNFQEVIDQWNKLLEKDLNTTVKLNFTSWNDWQTKYKLLLTTGEKIDMIFASSWADYFKFAKQGSFLPLDDLLPTYAPVTWSKVPKQDWIEATVLADHQDKAHIYAVPATYPEYTPDGLVYREDWRQELNLPEIKDMDSIEAYLDGVKQAKPDVIPINGKAYNEVFSMFRYSNGFESIGSANDGANLIMARYDKPRDIVAYPFTPEFEAYVKRMKTWADKGFWSSDSLSSQKEPGDAIKVGNGAAYLRNAPAAGGYIVNLKVSNPDIKVGYFPFSRFHHYAMPTISVNNAMAIPASAAHPKRSLMVLDKLRNDQQYFDLMTYGIKGENYSIADDGKTLVTPPKGVDPDGFVKFDYAYWGWRVDTMVREKQAAGWDGFDSLLKEFKDESRPNVFAGVILDFKPVEAQNAAINQVFQQYGKPLFMGFVPDVDKALAQFREKLKQAGVDQVLDYAKKTAYQYFDEKGIK